MKKNIFLILIVLFIAYILVFPEVSVKAAAAGLILWYERVLPALLPFSILSNILISSHLLSSITGFLTPFIRFLIPVSREGAFVLFSGFFFGFPMGSKNCSELLKNNQISLAEAEILFIMSNNISPIFISGYIFGQQLNMPQKAAAGLAILYLPPLLLGTLALRRAKRKSASMVFAADSPKNNSLIQKKPASGSQINFKIIDAGIMNGFETLAKLGGYIMLFSIAASFLRQLPFPGLWQTLGIGITEITNGISELSGLSLPPQKRFLLAIGFTAFGGISGLAQTASMIKGTGLSMKKYFLGKLVLTTVTMGCAMLYLVMADF